MKTLGNWKRKKKTNKISWVFHHKTKSWKRSLTLPLATAWAEFPWEFSIFKSSLEQLNRLNSWSAICMAIFWCFPICELKSSTAPMLIMDLEQLFLLSWARSTLDHVNNCRTKKQIMSDIEELAHSYWKNAQQTRKPYGTNHWFDHQSYLRITLTKNMPGAKSKEDKEFWSEQCLRKWLGFEFPSCCQLWYLSFLSLLCSFWAEFAYTANCKLHWVIDLHR